MKIIDDKGRLFGAVNVIDFIVVLFLLSFIPMAYLGYKAVAAEKYAEEKSWADIQLRCEGVIPEAAAMLREGDSAKDPLSNVNMRLVSIAGMKPSEGYAGRKDVVLDLRIPCTTKNGFLLYKDKPVRIGEPVVFATENYAVAGYITGVAKRE